MALRSMTLAVAMLCACALAAPGAASAQSSPAVPAGFVGVNVDGPLFPFTAPGVDLGSQMDTMVASGVETVRVVFDWSYAQPYKTSGDVPAAEQSEFVNVGGIPTRWGDLDAFMAAAAAHGLKVMPTVLYTPSWDAAPHPPSKYAEFPSPRQVGPYANFLSDLVKRYGPHGTFWQTTSPAVPIRSWQIWNEPNINTYWPKQPFQKTYGALLSAAHNAIKRLDPHAQVVLAGLPNYSWKQLGLLYKTVRGVRKMFDAVALHPYTLQPQGVITILQKGRQVMNAAGDASKPIIADEISWPSSLGQTSHDDGIDIATTESGQASKIATLLPLLVKDRRALNLGGFFYYTWAGRDDRNGSTFDFAGLLHFDAATSTFKPKPAFGAFQKAALAMEHCRKKGTVATICATRS